MVLLTVVLLHTVLGSNITTMSVVVPGLMSIGAGVAPPLPLMFLICIAVCSQFLLPFHHVILLLGEGDRCYSTMSCSGLAFPIPLLCFSPYFCSISPGGGCWGRCRAKRGGFRPMSGANIKRLMDPEILAAIMDSATDGFTYTDETGYIVYNNRAYSEMTGLPDEKIQGHNIHQLVKEGFPISRMMLEVFQSRETRSELIKYQADSERLLLVTLSPVYSPDGRFRGAVGNVRDMTELMQLRQQMDITYLDYDREMQVKEKANRELVQRINEMLHLMEDYDIVGRSKAMHNLAELALRVSHVRSTVLITGESGVGKDVFCRMICRFAGSPDYIKISCGNLPENLLESELFGYEAGAFTGANRTGKRGIFELAGDGVIFLDEIGELRPSSRSSC